MLHPSLLSPPFLTPSIHINFLLQVNVQIYYETSTSDTYHVDAG
jgi:hypothetical protein